MAHSPRARSCFKQGGVGKTNKTNKWHQSVRHLGLCPGEDSGTPVEKRDGQGEKTLISLDRSTRSTHWEEGTQLEGVGQSQWRSWGGALLLTTGKWTDHKSASHWIRFRGKPKSARPEMGTHGHLSYTFCMQTRAAELNPRATANS